MDRYRIQTWKTNEELIRYVDTLPANFEYIDGTLEEIIPTSRHAELNGVILDCYQTNNQLVIVVQSEGCLYQIISDDIGCQVQDHITGPINNHDSIWYSF